MRLLLCLLCLGTIKSFAATEIPAGQTLNLRLETYLASYSAKPGDPIRAILTTPVVVGNEMLLPAGTHVYGEVVRAHRIGFGMVHERASLEIAFLTYENSAGERVPLQAKLIAIDNAREQVTPRGEIKGVLAAGGYPGLIHGTWYRPPLLILSATSSGFQNIAPAASQALATAPISMAVFFAGRLLLVRWAEPEIHLEPGTDLSIRLQQPLPVERAEPVLTSQPAAELLSLVQDLPLHTTKDRNVPAADLTNLLFFGTRADLEDAFFAAGWHSADPMSNRARLRAYRAWTGQSAYETAPMSTIRMQGRKPDLMFQKTLNTVSKRHHIRLWQLSEQYDGQPVWVGAATHDIGFERVGQRFTHQIDPAIDAERRKIVQDLTFAGCTERQIEVERPAVAAEITHVGKALLRTDGKLSVVAIRPCEPTVESSLHVAEQPPALRGAPLERASRRFILEVRQTVERGHIFYWGMRLAASGFTRFRHHGLLAHSPAAPAAAGPSSD